MWYSKRSDMDGWTTCDFMSPSTLFQSYQDDGSVIMIGSVQWDLIYGWKDFHLKWGLNLLLSDQLASALSTELPGS